MEGGPEGSGIQAVIQLSMRIMGLETKETVGTLSKTHVSSGHTLLSDFVLIFVHSVELDSDHQAV